MHRITGADEPQGWDNQIQFEPGLVVNYENRYRLLEGKAPLGSQWDVLGTWGAAVGNIDTHAALGPTVRWGFNVPRDFGVNTISTSAMEACSACAPSWPSIYLFGSGEGRGVARNVFLDGNTWRDSHSVEKEHLVGEFRGGLAIQYKALRFTYTWITRSPEFEGQPGWTRYGSLSLGLYLDF